MGSGVLLVLKPPDQKRSDIGVTCVAGFGCPRMLLRKKVCLLPDQIKPIEPLVPVN
jgi:hypothetical protein